MQRIHNEVEFEIEDLDPGDREKSSSNPGDAWGVAALLKNFIRPFDLAHTPLLRVGLVKTPNKQALLLLDLHHIISDAVSHNILVRDFMALGAGEELPGLRLQYKDFSQWQDDLIRSGALKTQQEYWLQELSGELPRLNLPTDYPRPRVQDFAGSEVTFAIAAEKVTALKEMALAQGVTLYMIFLALYNVFLGKLCGQEDIIIGAVGAGRRHADLEQIIGMFVNTLVMRNYPSGEKTFKEFLAEVGKRTIAAIENQDYQFEDLVENLAPANNHHRNPLFDAGFGFLDIQGTSREQVPPPGKNQYQFHHPTSRFDLSLYCFRTGNILNCIFEYRTSLFKEETITLFSNYFKDLTAAISKNKNILLKDLHISHGFKDHRLEIPRGDFEF